MVPNNRNKLIVRAVKLGRMSDTKNINISTKGCQTTAFDSPSSFTHIIPENSSVDGSPSPEVPLFTNIQSSIQELKTSLKTGIKNVPTQRVFSEHLEPLT